MHDPAKDKQLLDLATKAIKAHTEIFIRPARDPARINGVVNKLREVWIQYPEFRLAQLVFNVSGATQPCPEIFYLEDDALLRGLDSFESQEQSGES